MNTSKMKEADLERTKRVFHALSKIDNDIGLEYIRTAIQIDGIRELTEEKPLSLMMRGPHRLQIAYIQALQKTRDAESLTNEHFLDCIIDSKVELAVEHLGIISKLRETTRLTSPELMEKIKKGRAENQSYAVIPRLFGDFLRKKAGEPVSE